MKRFTIIVAGGSGKRFGNKLPKQFVEVCGKPVLMHSIEKFYAIGGEIIIVLPSEFTDYWKELCTKHSFFISQIIVEGGKTRTESVLNGLAVIKEDGVVAIHDSVRPLVSKTLIEKLFVLAAEKGNAIPAIEIQHSIRHVENDSNYAVDRKNYRIIQTPQCFKIRQLKEAYLKIKETEYTDDASVFEAAGHKIFLTEGEPTNIKITNAQDLQIAETFIKSGFGSK